MSMTSSGPNRLPARAERGNFNRFTRSPVSRLAWALAALLVVTLGCARQETSELEDLQSVSLVSSGSELPQTMKYIESDERFEMNEFRDKVNSGLNRFMSTRSGPSGEWKKPELVETLPQAVREAPIFSQLGEDSFSGNDAWYVQETWWIEKVASRIARSYPIFNHEYHLQLALAEATDEEKEQWQESKNLLVEVVARLNPDLSRENPDASTMSEVEQLARAMELFDWTVRNVQLAEPEPWPTPDSLDQAALISDPADDAWPAAVGAKGPGYVRFPWQTLTYGKGDWLERAEVFSRLCRASGLSAAVLAVNATDENSARPYQEWIPAVLIGGELYLFDTRLGLPISGETPGSIATLSAVVNNPKLLAKLDLTDETGNSFKYPVGADELSGLIALVSAGPESVSQRMREVTGALTGDFRIELATEVDALAERFRGLPGIESVAMWHVPWSVHLFREQVGIANNKAQFDPEVRAKLAWQPENEFYVDNFVLFRTARNMYLRGEFESDRSERKRSALSYYFAFMYTDEDISDVETNSEVQERLGVRKRAGQDVNNFQVQLAYLKGNMNLIRADAAFFLALAHYENGYPQPALNWLDRMPGLDLEFRWEPWRSYQKGRAYEASGNYADAAAEYSRDHSAQRHGSLIRAGWMKDLIERDSGSRP